MGCACFGPVGPGRSCGSPLGDGLGVDAAALGEAPQAFLTMLYRSTDCRCRCGAAVENLAHSASFHSRGKIAPSSPGTKQLARRVYAPPPFSAPFTLWLSITAAVGLASQPDRSRHCTCSAWWMRPKGPSQSHRALVAAALGGRDQGRHPRPLGVKQVGEIAQRAVAIASTVLGSPHHNAWSGRGNADQNTTRCQCSSCFQMDTESWHKR